MALQLFGDFSFVGGEDTTANPYQDAQECINYFPEISPSKGAKEAASLLGTPGLIQVATAGQILPQGSTWTADSAVITAGDANAYASGQNAIPQTSWPATSTVTNLPVRGMWVLPGWTQALVVIANTCYLASIVQRGSLSTPGALNLTSVGTLLTSAGPVGIRDNGTQGGFATIVDGSATGVYQYNIATQAFTNASSIEYLGNAASIASIDGWWIFNKNGSAIFFTSAQPYSEAFNASYYAIGDSSSDQLMAVIENKEELWLIKERTAEIWYDAGGTYFPFQRLVGTPIQTGCIATYSVARLTSQGQESLMWLGRSERGENIVVRTMGFSPTIVSTPAVSNAIAQYTVTSDAIAYTYEEGNHEFYVLLFPTADKTWVYDATMPPALAWHQRLSYDPYAQQYHRHRSNCFMNFGGMRIVGDYQNGSLYQMTRNAYTDAGWPIKARRRSPYIWSKEDRERVFMSSLQVEFSPGQGAASGLGANPQANLRISRDYGTTYGPALKAPMGAIGQYTNRCMWRKLGWSRGAVAEIEVIAPVNRDIVGVTLKAYGA